MFRFIRVFLIAAAMLAQYQSAAAADTTAQAQPAEAQGIGVVKTKDEQNRTVTLAHDPIEGFHWPAMTMKFKVANPARHCAGHEGAVHLAWQGHEHDGLDGHQARRLS